MSKTVIFNQQKYALKENESVLDCLLRNDLNLPFGCKAGACQSCVMQIDKGQIPVSAQPGLSDVQKKLGYFLPCSCSSNTLKNDLEISAVNDINQQISTRVIAADKLNETIIRLRLEKTIDFQAGQYISIWLDQRRSRSYSIASLPSENFIELHVKKIVSGAFSELAYQTLKPGDSLNISGPMGQCIYATNDKSEPLLLSGIGTGLAPLYGITKEAIDQGHSGTISIVLGARESSQFYLVDDLLQLAKTHDNIDVHFVSQVASHDFSQQGDIYQFVKTQLPSTQEPRIYLCGAQSFVTKMRKQCFLAGAAMNRIHADIFLPAAS